MTAEEKGRAHVDETPDGIPSVMVQQAEAAATAARQDDEEEGDKRYWAQSRLSTDSLDTSVYASSTASVDTAALTEIDTALPDRPIRDSPSQPSPPSYRPASTLESAALPDVPPPAYGNHYGTITGDHEGLETKAVVLGDGRVDINIDQQTRKLASILGPALQREAELAEDEEPPPAYIPPSLGGADGQPPPPPMNVVIHVVGSRGDVQPFVALGKVLKERYGHRVRLATHLTFRDFVTKNGLEFFNIGGDPAKLMAFMVKNPGLMPGITAIQDGEIGMRRLEIREMLRGCWRSCYEAGDGTGPAANDASIAAWTANGTTMSEEESSRPFVADAIIANPPSFAHVHVAEKLGIPLHIMFTMPYSPTQAFPHPLANIQSSTAEANITNYISYVLVELLTWQGLGDVVNSFRNKDLGLDDIGVWSAQILHRLKIPHTYCWSPALIPKPSDWRRHISISGFFFLDSATGYTPPPDLAAFLKNGPPPVYIGFGSIVLDDPNGMTELIFEGVRRSGQRAIVSQGWGGIGGEELDKPDDVLMLGNCPHDWLFEHVSCVVHHGGAGTTAIGIKAGKPTAVVPFFGDQPFWGAMISKAGAGPEAIPHKQLTATNLAEAIQFCLRPQTLGRAQELGAKMAQESGSETGAQSFHQFLKTDELRCSIAPSHAAVWRVKRSKIRLSALAACTLANAGVLDFKNLKLFRPREYDTDPGPYEPISGGAEAMIGTISAIMGGVMHMPLKSTKKKQRKKSVPREGEASSSRPAGMHDFDETDAKSMAGSVRSEASTVVASSDTVTAPSARSGSTAASIGSGTNTPATTRNGSTFNLEESLAKLDDPIISLHRSRSSQASGSQQATADRLEVRQRPEASRRTSGSGFDPRTHLEMVQNTGQGIAKIVEASMKSPMGLTSSLASGFHNAPKLYGDTTVRPKERVTGIGSGLRAAGKGFGLGMYDGITGLITQPMQGLAKEGPAGFVKGIGKGIGGIVLKPGAAVFGIPGYTMKGIYKEMYNMLGSSVQNYIIAARTAQGYEQWNASTREERDDIVKRYLRVQREGIVSPDSQREPPVMLVEQPHPQSADRSNTADSTHPPNDHSDAGLPSYEAARTVRSPTAAVGRDTAVETLHLSHPTEQLATTLNDRDAELEAAIRASMAESSQRHDLHNDDEELERVMAASLAESNSQARDYELEQALAASLAEHKGKQPASSEQQQQRYSTIAGSSEPPPAYDERFTAANFEADQKTAGERTEENIVLEYIRKQSMLEGKHAAGRTGSREPGPAHSEVDEDDEDVRRAIEMSLREHK